MTRRYKETLIFLSVYLAIFLSLQSVSQQSYGVLATKPNPKFNSKNNSNNNKNNKNTKNNKNAANAKDNRPKPPKLNIDVLPPLTEVLEALQLTDFLKHFVKMGVTETRLLLKLSSMDFQIMSMDWPDMTDDKITELKKKIQELYTLATVSVEEENPELEERKKLSYGRVYLENGVNSFEYKLATFGGLPLLGKQHLEISKTLFECSPVSSEEDDAAKLIALNKNENSPNYHQRLVLVKRGLCPFVEKALNAFHHNASGIIVVNSEDKLESPSSGIGIYRNITEESLAPLKSFPVVSVSNNSGEALYYAAKFHDNQSPDDNDSNFPVIYTVPLKCHIGGKCLPVVKEEAKYSHEVLWGKMKVSNLATGEVKVVEYLTSNYGANIPVHRSFPISFAQPVELCNPDNTTLTMKTLADRESEDKTELTVETGVSGATKAESSLLFNSILIAHRGGCRFDVKTYNAQLLGTRLLAVVDIADNPLQRLGGMHPEAGYLGIPGILITAEAGRYLESQNTADLEVEFFPSRTTDGFDNWVDISSMDWVENPSDRILQMKGLIQKYSDTENLEIVEWLERRIRQIEQSLTKSD